MTAVKNLILYRLNKIKSIRTCMTSVKSDAYENRIASPLDNKVSFVVKDDTIHDM